MYPHSWQFLRFNKECDLPNFVKSLNYKKSEFIWFIDHKLDKNDYLYQSTCGYCFPKVYKKKAMKDFDKYVNRTFTFNTFEKFTKESVAFNYLVHPKTKRAAQCFDIVHQLGKFCF